MNRSQKIRFNKARKFALSGEFENAIPIFEQIADEEEESANASLAEIYGFLFDWEKCLNNAGKFIANPNATYAGNVFDDAIRLLGRAADETNHWNRVEDFCNKAIKRIEIEDYQTWQRNRYIKILKNLKNYAEREGKPPHELVRIFGIQTEFDKLSSEENQAQYNNAVEATSSLRPDLTGKYEETIRHKIALAILFNQTDEATKLFLANQNLQIYDFEFLAPIFKYLIKIGERKTAWQAIKDKVPFWIPVDITQIAPVSLLTDEDLKIIINAERSLRILKTPRYQ